MSSKYLPKDPIKDAVILEEALLNIIADEYTWAHNARFAMELGPYAYLAARGYFHGMDHWEKDQK